MARSPFSYDPRFALNAICPYLTMFPLEYPLQVLERHREQRPLVVDPFCGRGTTLFAARMLGLPAVGIDVSPVAAAIARAKLCTVDVEATLALARTLIERNPTPLLPADEFFHAAFDANVLHELCAIRTGLLQAPASDAAVLLRAAMLGCLHGPTNKRGPLSYLSAQMPRTVAFKPDPLMADWVKKGTKPPKVDVLELLARKLARVEKVVPAVTGSSSANVVQGDARDATAWPVNDAGRPVVVVTSPPYYGMRTYVQDQWLRAWFLGGPETVAYGAGVQVAHSSHDEFAQSLGQVWANVARMTGGELDLYVRFGTIPSVRSDARELMQTSLIACKEASGVDWEVVSMQEAQSAAAGNRQAVQMGVRSKATLEWDFHVRRVPPFLPQVVRAPDS
jgi:hypothetical protein